MYYASSLYPRTWLICWMFGNIPCFLYPICSMHAPTTCLSPCLAVCSPCPSRWGSQVCWLSGSNGNLPTYIHRPKEARKNATCHLASAWSSVCTSHPSSSARSWISVLQECSSSIVWPSPRPAIGDSISSVAENSKSSILSCFAFMVTLLSHDPISLIIFHTSYAHRRGVSYYLPAAQDCCRLTCLDVYLHLHR